MSDSKNKETEVLIGERVCRVTFDCKIRICEITPELLNKGGPVKARGQELALRDVERQRQLLHSILRDAKTLDRFLTYVVVCDLGVVFDTDLALTFPVEEDDEILRRVSSVVDRNKASPAADEDQISDSPVEDTEALHACLEVDWRETILRGIEFIPGGADLKEMKR